MSYYQPNPPPYSQPYAQPYSGYDQPPPYGEHHHEEAPLRRDNSDKFSQTSFRDIPFGLLFILHLIGFTVLTVVGALKKSNQGTEEAFLNDFKNLFPTELDHLKWFLVTLAILGVIGLVTSFLLLVLIRKAAKQLIYIGIFFTIFSWFAAGVGLLTQRLFIWGILCFFFGGLLMLLFYSWRKRIPFAVEMLKTISRVIETYPAITVVAYLSIVIEFGWVIWWVFTVTLLQHFDLNLAYFLSFFLLVSLYWTVQVIKNTVHVTAGGVFASWYFLFPVPHNPTLGSLKRATTTSFGSICLGSLLVALLQALRAVLRAAASRNNFVAAIANCFLGCIEGLVRYFNKYAFAQVSIYGKSYCQAARDTWSLIHSHGFEAIVNDNLISGVLGICTLAGGLIGGFAGLAFGLLLVPSFVPMCVVFGFLICYILVLLTMEIVESGVATIFVCFAMDPAALMRNDPALYALFKQTYHHCCDLFN